MSPAKYSDSDEDAFRRITKGLIEWRNSTAKAMALILECKEREIWKLKYASFKEFCELECGFTKQWGYDLLKASKIVKELKSSVLDPKSGKTLAILDCLTPAHTAPLEGHSAKEQTEILATAQANTANPDGIPTAADVRKAEAEYEPKEPEGISEPPAPKDKMGYILPEEVIALWNRGDEEILALVSHLSKAKKEIKDAYGKSDPLYHGFDCQGWMTDLEGVIYKLKCHRPYAVCPVCQGKLSKRCACCKGRGFVGKAYWEGPSVFVEMRKMRETMIAKQAA